MDPKETSVDAANPFRIDAWTVVPSRNRLVGSDGEVKLEPKIMDLLVLLCRHSGETLSKKRLLEVVWHQQFVTDSVLIRGIAEIRRALGDDAQNPRYIETVPRRGYRFVGGLSEVSAERSTGGRARLIALVVGAIALAAGVGRWTLTESSSQPFSEAWDQARFELVSVAEGSRGAPVLSPDGLQLAFLKPVNGVSQIFVAQVQGGEPRMVTRGEIEARRPRWSSRGEIFFWRPEAGLFAVEPGTGEERQVLEIGRDPDPSTDGERLVFQDHRRIWTVAADGSDAEVVEGVQEWYLASVAASPSFSPDGSQIAYFLAELGPKGNLWTISSLGGEPRRLTSEIAEYSGLSWSPDGRWVYCSSTLGGSRTLWRVGVDGEALERVTVGAGEDRSPSLSGNGRRLLYATSATRHAVVLLDPETGREEDIFTTRFHPSMPEASPDGRQLVFFLDQGSSAHVYLADLGSQQTTRITTEPGFHIHPRFSPDGHWIYYYRAHPAPAFVRISIAGGSPEVVYDGWVYQTQKDARISPEGDRLVYLEDRAQSGRLFVVDLDSGEREALAEPHMHALSWSPDGTAILGHRHDGQVGLCTADGSACRSLVHGRSPRWSRDGRSILFRRPLPTPGYSQIFRVDEDGQSELGIAEIGPVHPHTPTFAVVEGDRLVYSRVEREAQEVWMASLEPSAPLEQ